MGDAKTESLNVARGVLGGQRGKAGEVSQMFLGDLARFRNAAPDVRSRIQEEAFNRAMRDFPQRIPGVSGSFNLAPNAPNLVVRFSDGTIGRIPRGGNIPPNAVVLNKSVDEIREVMPTELRPPVTPSAAAPAAVRAEEGVAAAPIGGQPRQQIPTPAADASIASERAAQAEREAFRPGAYRGPWTRRGPMVPPVSQKIAPEAAAPAASAPRTIPTREPDLGLPLGAAGLAGTAAILAEQRGDVYTGGKGAGPEASSASERLDDSKFYERSLGTGFEAPQVPRSDPTRLKGQVVGDVYGSFPSPEGDQDYYRSSGATFFPQTHIPNRNYVMPKIPRQTPSQMFTEFDQGAPQYPMQPPPRDMYAEFNEPAPNYLGSVGRAGALPIMARPDGGRGDGAEVRPVIDPSILMLARERLMPYSARGVEGRVSSDSAPASSSARTGSSGPRAASSTSAESRPAGGLFSFKDPYEGMSSSRLMQLASERPDDPAMYFRADAALRRERPEMFEKKSEGGMARGGSAGSGKGGKDDAVMKALEIIHHMLSNR